MLNRWASGRCTAADSNLLDYPWLQAKLNASGTADLEREFDHRSNQAGLKRSRRVLRNASHFLAAQPEQLSSQHLARWPTDPPGGSTVAAGVEPARPGHHPAPEGWRLSATHGQPPGFRSLAAPASHPCKHAERPGGAPRRAAHFGDLGSHHQALEPNHRQPQIQPAAIHSRCRHHRPRLPARSPNPGSRRRQRPIALVAPAWALSPPPRHVSLCTDPLQAPVACS